MKPFKKVHNLLNKPASRVIHEPLMQGAKISQKTELCMVIAAQLIILLLLLLLLLLLFIYFFIYHSRDPSEWI